MAKDFFGSFGNSGVSRGDWKGGAGSGVEGREMFERS
jgi:hypothetical protein